MLSSERCQDLKGFEEAVKDIADTILSSTQVTIVGHVDADGISGASIASVALGRAGIPCDVKFIKKLDDAEIAAINARKSDTFWLVDLGSGSYSKFVNDRVCVSDHHLPEKEVRVTSRSGQADLFSYTEHHANPHIFGIDGSTEISGAGVAYLVAKAMGANNVDLAPIAIIGAVGDFQDSAECRLRGLNRRVLKDAIDEEMMAAIKDLRVFGRETRPVGKMLQFSTDPILPGLTNDAVACQRFLMDLGIPLTEGEKWRCWVDLTELEKRQVASALCDHLLDSGSGHWACKRLIGEVYVLRQEKFGTELHDAKEFSTLLNACGRYGEGMVGLRICAGDRGDFLEKGLRLQRNHRGNLADAVGLVMDLGVERGRFLQHFHGRAEILDSIVGIVAGMVLGSGEVPSDLPIVAFAYSEDEKVKVSARATRELVQKGIDLATAMKIASERVGGTGGGHNIAAGATISIGKEEEFLAEMERLIQGQLSGSLNA
ncbi:MAG: DHH family phosphoesterase [Methanomassiliicoccales archaeon]|nr:DHH family phosphoesterase [Methanomassiliicoccales archaeon]